MFERICQIQVQIAKRNRLQLVELMQLDESALGVDV